jgi:hypothetical protein
MALLRADILTSIQYIILIILINMINQQALITKVANFLNLIFINRFVAQQRIVSLKLPQKQHFVGARLLCRITATL